MLRVDTIPWHLKPFFLLFGYSIGLYFYCYTSLIRLTCRIRFTGAPVPKDTPVIYCIWHHDLVPYFGVFSKVSKQVWMNHPAWYMKPVHVMLKFTGVEHICLGSSGNSGKAALDNVVSFLKEGYTTTIASDGPAGPPQILKPGVLWMSRDAGVPVVPLRFVCRGAFRIGGWDRKFMPWIFSEIEVIAGESIQVTDENIESASESITRHLNGII